MDMALGAELGGRERDGDEVVNPPTRGERWPGRGNGAAPSPCMAGNVLAAGYGLGGTWAGIYLLPFKSFPLLTPLYFPQAQPVQCIVTRS